MVSAWQGGHVRPKYRQIFLTVAFLNQVAFPLFVCSQEVMSREMLAECPFQMIVFLLYLTECPDPSQKIKKFPATCLDIGWQVFHRPFYGIVLPREAACLAHWITEYSSILSIQDSVHLMKHWTFSCHTLLWLEGFCREYEKINSHPCFSS